MKTLLATAMTIGMLALSVGALMAQSANDLFQQALVKERTDGNMQAAIALYQTIVQKYAADRALVAKALVQMGQCYEKLGGSEATKAYERVVREFGDQAASVAAARTQLALMRQGPVAGNDISFRRVGDGSQNEYGAAVSYDGRYIAHHLHPDTLGTLAVRELATGKVYPLAVRAPGSRDQPDLAVVSRDSKTVAFGWGTYDDGYELRTIPLQTSALGQPRRLFRTEDKGFAFPYDWTPDGSRIAVALSGKDGTRRIGLVSTADGSVQVLKSADSRFAVNNRMSFSPDGKYLAYDLAQVEHSEQRDVFVMAVDGSRETAAVAHPSLNTFAGWSPDGTQILFFSDRTGSRGLWSQGVVDGRPQGAASLIKADVGSSASSMGMTASGALYVSTAVSGSDIEIVPVDFAAGQVLGNPVKPIPDYVGSNSQPEWSADGRFMAYVSRREGHLVLAMRELATGNVRVISPQLSTIASKVWSPDRKAFAALGTDLKRRIGLFLVDAETGVLSAMVSTVASGYPPSWSPDGKKLYYRASVGNEVAFVERDMPSGAEREIIRRPSLGVVDLSPDGRWFAAATELADGRFASVILFPAAGGEARELMRANQPALGFGIGAWAPDSNSIMLKRWLTADRTIVEYWQVPILGGGPRRLDLKIDIPGLPRLHPDGRQLAYTTTTARKDEVWVLENFLPKAGGAK